MSEPQSYQTHVRRLPTSVNALYVILVVNVIWSAYRLITLFSVDALVAFLIAIALPWLGIVSRHQTLTVQNRVIRLEERLRFASVLPADVAARAGTLPISQIVALRFASDEELPMLVEEVLSGRLSDGKAIKQRVRAWRADHLRA